jgi:hypothetical protein
MRFIRVNYSQSMVGGGRMGYGNAGCGNAGCGNAGYGKTAKRQNGKTVKRQYDDAGESSVNLLTYRKMIGG